MKLVIINGSPRGRKSNSEVISNWILEGMSKSLKFDKFYTARIDTHKEAVSTIIDNTTLLVVFPLYVDAMPGITKLFFEELQTIKNKRKNVKIYFIVHSGFNGARHCRAVERYLVYLSEYLGFKYMGTAVKPGSEGFRLMPEDYTLHIKNVFIDLSKNIEKTMKFNLELLKVLAGYEIPSEEIATAVKASDGNSGYFSYLLKQNNAFDKSFNKPYERKDK